jgi:hypothetical protein
MSGIPPFPFVKGATSLGETGVGQSLMRSIRVVFATRALAGSCCAHEHIATAARTSRQSNADFGSRARTFRTHALMRIAFPNLAQSSVFHFESPRGEFDQLRTMSYDKKGHALRVDTA